MELINILAKHPVAVKAFYDNGQLEYGTDFFNELYDYFVSSGEMPYGVAKARTGAPDQWIADQLDGLLN